MTDGMRMARGYMRRSITQPALAGLPETIPILPLGGALLLPGGRLPLTIFDPANLDMIADVLTTPGRLVGMVQKKEAHICPPTGTGHKAHCLSRLYPVGCMGRISSFAETGDGRSLITLDGVIRFRILGRVGDRHTSYLRCRVAYDEFKRDLHRQGMVRFDRTQLIVLLRRYFKDHGFTADWETLYACGDEKLVNTLAMICPLGVQQKQVLLEAKNAGVRGDALSQLLQLEDEDATHDGH